MPPEKPTESNESIPLLPREELLAWINERYNNENDKYTQELKDKQIRAVENENILDLENLSNVLFVTKSFLAETSPEEYARLSNLHDRLMKWLRPRIEKL